MVSGNIVLAVASKNDEAEALRVFDEHPAMRIRRDDIACFAANWDTKVDNLRLVAETLGLGLDALVYADDNPAEREIVRRFLPEVDVLPLPRDPARYARTLSEYLLFETANPRHGHEWAVFRDRRAEIPDDRILVPGVVDTTTNFVEHPDLVAERLRRFTDIVGPERVMAGSDCGFGTFAGFGAVDPEIAWAKLATLAEGARRVR